MVERIADLTEVQYQQKVAHLKAVRKYFTYAGMDLLFVVVVIVVIVSLFYLVSHMPSFVDTLVASHLPINTHKSSPHPFSSYPNLPVIITYDAT